MNKVRGVPEEPSEQLERMFTRKEIAKGLSQKGRQRLAEIRADVRSALKKKFHPTLESIKSEEFYIDPRLRELALLSQQELQKRFPLFPNLSVVVLGSGLQPSGRVKALFRDKVAFGDFDWGITFDYFTTLSEDEQRAQRGEMVKVVNEVLTQNGKRLNLDGIQSCDEINPSYKSYLSQEFYAHNFLNKGQAIHYLIARKGSFVLHDPIFLYFQPSVPAEVNQRNLRYLLEALGDLSLQDYELYQTTVKNLIADWEQVREISLKHFENRFINYDDNQKQVELSKGRAHQIHNRDYYLSHSFYYQGQPQDEFLTHHFAERLRKTDRTK